MIPFNSDILYRITNFYMKNSKAFLITQKGFAALDRSWVESLFTWFKAVGGDKMHRISLN